MASQPRLSVLLSALGGGNEDGIPGANPPPWMDEGQAKTDGGLISRDI